MDNELYHYGVKGMKWGQRKFIPRIGRRRRAAAQPIVSTRKRLSGNDSTQIAQRRKAVRRASNLKKVAKGAAIVGGTALAAYGAYKMHGVLKDPGNRRIIKTGAKMYADMAKSHAENAYNKASNFYRNTRHIINTPKRIIQSTKAGKIAFTGLAGASLLSDANSIQQWVRRIHKNGKVTGKDIKDLGIDILNPIPNNIPRFDKMIKNKLNHSELYSKELYHHGVKGMKWGIRKAIRSFGKNRSARIKKRNDRYREKMYRKTKDAYYKNAPDKNIQAERRGKIARNVAIGVGVAAVAVIGAHYVDRYITQHKDSVIKAGKVVQTVGNHNNMAAGNKFYAAHKWQDKIKYIGGLGAKDGNFKNIYKGTVNKDIKVLGIDNGKKLYKSFANKNSDILLNYPTYEAFNQQALIGSGKSPSALNKFPGLKAAFEKNQSQIESFKKMVKNKGYDAIADWNDRVKSGYNTKAFINLESSKSLYSNIKVSKITSGQYNKYNKAFKALLYKDAFKVPALTAIGVGAGYKAYDKQSEIDYEKEKYKKRK